ncbi:MAG TPA: phospholipid carrier-dependent glycosyltransferase [Nitrospirae bacterium]|nr:phospholipid carrier-dependent glycosyltransferase [Nitrospirota bacterium]
MGSFLRNLLLLIILFIFIFFIQAFNASFCSAENILKNPDFEEVINGKPTYWEFDVWNKDPKGYRFGFDIRSFHSGTQSIVIEATEPNDLKIMQRLSLKEDRVYKFSCWVKASNIPTDNKGANISALDILDTSENLYDTQGQWKELVFYGKTAKGQTEVIFTLRLGGYGSINKGITAFDNCKVVLLDTVPSGIKIAPLKREQMEIKQQSSLTDSSKGLIFTLLSSIIFVALLIISLRYLKSRDALPYSNKTFLLSLLLSTSLLKIILSYLTTGFPVDLITYKAWSDLLVKKGLSEFYYSGYFVDYPPFYMYVFYVIGLLRHLFNIPYDSQLFVLLLKLPSLLAEAMSVLLLYKVSKETGIKIGSVYMILILFTLNPVLIINTCLWGQVDSFLTFFIVLSLVLLQQKRLFFSAIFFTISILTKPQALMYSPLFLFYLFLSKPDYKECIKALIASIITAFVIILPFSINHGPYWIVNIFKNALVQYPFATLNAFNIHALFGNNWSPVMDKWIIFSFKTWGTIFILLITITSAYLFIKSKHILIIALFIVLSVFMFSTEMHERYMVPSFLLFSMVYVFTKDTTILYLFTGFTITNTFNLAYTLMLAHHGIYHLSPDDIILRAFSLFNLILYCLTVKKIINLLFEDKSEVLQKEKPLELPKNEFNSVINSKDILTMVLIAFLFSALYLHKLGDTKSPQTYWQPSAKGEGMFIDFNRVQDISKINYFYGITKGKIRIDSSDDFVNWQTITFIEPKGVFMWKSKDVNIKARYLSIITEEPSLMLYEIGLFDKSGNLIRGISPSTFVVMKETKGSFRHLFDEQDLVPQRPSYLNSMYFDEIYFARTAYEHIHGIEPYENTHPPLGKLIMALSVKVFSMSPFGWRFSSAIFGVFVVLLMYLMGKLLFGKIQYGIFASSIMGFDFMTFVQSRIGTVDIIAITFIVAMYYFMFRFYLSDDDSNIKNLALSGICFGLGASVKWLCLYSGIGLAVIYFCKLYNQAKISNKVFTRFIMWGLIFFVIIPLVIYFLTFIPFMLLPGAGHDFVDVLKLQEHMYQYHKSAKGSHPFASTWWQWLIIYKPIWLYMGENLPLTKAESIVSMGNPFIWWIGSLSILFWLYVVFIKNKGNLLIFFIITAFLSNYLPWLLVPRETYIYHFFASVPFLILSLIYVIKTIKIDKISPSYLLLAYTTSVIALFVLFYPILSGTTVDKTYISQYLKWFNSWIFFVP